MSKELITPDLKSAIVINDFLKPETATQNLTEVTPANIATRNFHNLSWRPYFSGKYNYGTITEGSELLPHEVLEILIPEWAVNQRIDALAKRVEAIILRSPEKCPVGTVLEAGRPFLNKVLSRLSSNAVTNLDPSVHIDIKSRYGTDIQGKGYEINLLPPPEKINGKTYLVFEMVADTCQTLQIIQRTLSQSPYQDVDLQVFLLVDKIDSHPSVQLPSCVKQCLFYGGDFWVVGCGGDVDGRFRQLPFVAKYRQRT